jgi:hypothetical protein
VKADFGARGDGVTDDFGAFRSALAAAKTWSDAHPSTGAVVTVPSGVYLVTQPLFVHGSRVVIRGTGSTREDVVLAFNHSLTEDYATNLFAIRDPSLRGSSSSFASPETRRCRNTWLARETGPTPTGRASPSPRSPVS